MCVKWYYTIHAICVLFILLLNRYSRCSSTLKMLSVVASLSGTFALSQNKY